MNYRFNFFIIIPLIFLFFIFSIAVAQPIKTDIKVNWHMGIGNSLSQPESFYGTKEAIRIAETILLYQKQNGGWPKNYDRIQFINDSIRTNLQQAKKETNTTIDNGSTHSEIRFLARVFNQFKIECYRQAFLNGVEFILEAQYPNGGWPQFYPTPKWYARHITFNDDAMVEVMTTLREIVQDKVLYSFIKEDLRFRIKNALDKGFRCILDCQIIVNGVKTAWCAQHDEITLEPKNARSYELASISGYESQGIVRLLMSIDNPSAEIIEAIQSAIVWYDRSKIENVRQKKIIDLSTPKGWDLEVIEDKTASPVWARFYDLKFNKPIYVDRDGISRKSLAKISYERRTGYSWLGYYGMALLAVDYPNWQKKWAPENNVLNK